MRFLQDTARVVLALWLALAPVKARAGSMMLLGAGTVSAGIVGPPTIALGAIAGTVNGSVNPQVTTSISIGSVAYDRTVFFLATANAHSPITSVTVTPNVGTAVTTSSMDVSQVAAAEMSMIGHVSLLSDAVTATTATVTITTSGTLFAGFVVGLYYAKTSDFSSLTPTGAFVAGPTLTTTTVNGTLATSTGGFVIAIAANNVTASNSTTFSGTESYTKDSDSSSAGIQRGFAHVNGVASNPSSGLTVTFAQSGTTTLAAAAYR